MSFIVTKASSGVTKSKAPKAGCIAAPPSRTFLAMSCRTIRSSVTKAWEETGNSSRVIPSTPGGGGDTHRGSTG